MTMDTYLCYYHLVSLTDTSSNCYHRRVSQCDFDRHIHDIITLSSCEFDRHMVNFSHAIM